MRPRDRLRLEARVRRKLDQQPLVADQIVEHGAQERRIERRDAQVLRAEPPEAKKPVQPVGIGGDEGERGHRQRSGGIDASDCLDFRNRA